jgi:hypothetical protein
MDLGQHLIFKRNTMFLKPALFSFSGREQSTTKVNRHNIIFWDFIHRIICSQNMMIQKPALFPSAGMEAPNLVDPLNWTILHHWAPQTCIETVFSPLSWHIMHLHLTRNTFCVPHHKNKVILPLPWMSLPWSYWLSRHCKKQCCRHV